MTEPSHSLFQFRRCFMCGRRFRVTRLEHVEVSA